MSTYSTRHWRVNTRRGPAKSQICVGCGSAAQEWAQKHGTDGEDPSDYDPMCCSCHGKYDDHWDEETRSKVAASVKEVWASTPERKQFSESHRAAMRAAWVRRKARMQGGDA